MKDNSKIHILLVDDEKLVRSVMADMLNKNGIFVTEASSGNKAVGLFAGRPFDAVLLDMIMPDMDGIATLKELKKINPDVPVIIVTGYGDVATAVEAIKLGAYDYVEKPVDENRIVLTIHRATEKKRMETKVRELGMAINNSLEWSLGESLAMKGVIGAVNKVAATDFSIVIEGETGTGKSTIARIIHNLSRRAKQPFVTVDMGLIPETLIESELFGHERGAFTGADRKKMGFFEAANGGTIFIDEMENMSLFVQSKLLRVVESRLVHPLGSTKPVEIDIRIIAATNKDIRRNVSQKQFREDLFFRLGEFFIKVPTLRDRHEDIPFFADKFLLEAAGELGKQAREISTEAMTILMSYSWPGNIRELKNVIRRAVLFCDSESIGSGDINFLIGDAIEQPAGNFVSLKDIVGRVEAEAISNALKISGNNRTKAASVLQIDQKTLRTKMKEYNLAQSD
ncbi:MAG: two component, sigma54 specific, transcriptional regulator, Fis family [Deltaproteobacteria bacterium]|nr:two component, sigma54 specific, transcriptional regulator, Fis family [Deltaproteobacteria bacterium]